MAILKEKIIRYETDGHTVKGFDAGELVRCKDCKFFTTDIGWNACVYHVCSFAKCSMSEDDYCSRAERKEE